MPTVALKPRPRRRVGGVSPVEALREIGFLLERSRADTYRVRAYRGAADVVAAMSEEQQAEHQRERSWAKVTGVGPKTATVITQALAGEVPAYLQQLRDEKEPLVEGGLEMRAAVRGDLHCHSTWSDGGSPLEEMMTTARSLGHEYLAITDHSPRLKVARGLTAERLREQMELVAELQERLAPFRCLQGIEVDILEDGGLDQTDELLAELDVVVASVHSKLRSDSETMTHRMVRAIANPRVNVLGHCTGRLIEGERGSPPPVGLRRRGGVRGVPHLRRRGGDQLPSRAARPADPSCCSWPSRWAACSRSTPMPMPRASWNSDLRLPAGRGSGAGSRPGDQHLAGGPVAGVGRPEGLGPPDVDRDRAHLLTEHPRGAGGARSSSRNSRSNSGRRSPNKCGVELDSEKTLATTSSAVRSTGRPAISIRRRSVNPAARYTSSSPLACLGQYAAASAALRPEIAADQVVRSPRRGGRGWGRTVSSPIP